MREGGSLHLQRGVDVGGCETIQDRRNKQN